jgi:hypothetical protein
MSDYRHLSLTALLFACCAGHAFAAEKPLWELGAGISALPLPDYRGSDQASVYAIPFPYLIYRGEFLKADRHGIRGTFFGTDRIELNLSLGASLPVNSDDNRARQGMPDLEPTVELGPSLDHNLWRTGDRRTRLDLRLPVRTAVTVTGGWTTSAECFRRASTSTSPMSQGLPAGTWDCSPAPCTARNATTTTSSIRWRRNTPPPAARRSTPRGATPAASS